MGALPGISGLADVQSRIAAIEARFTDGSSQATASSAAPAAPAAPAADSIIGAQPDFASVLQSAASSGTTAPNGGPDAASRRQFAHDVLTALGAPQTAENVRAIVAWAQAEGTAAAHNPLATTEAAPNTTNFNSAGVKNYPSYTEGVQATVATLLNGRYPNILAALADGSSAQAVAQAVAQSPWGTGNGVLRVLQSQPA